ncbi:hypothetical protein [Novosphingobium sp. ST904]|uniref:hypothetical protein n=1 Tax=Novosphingobium sp. ST904 TaxID=1684385 RepID=UPI0012E2037C|nr:hypothetical protein [Novosphingobium sp. ST904]
MALAIDFPSQGGLLLFSCRRNADQPVTQAVPNIERLLQLVAQRRGEKRPQ